MKVALLCSGLGRVKRGHEVFARGLFDLLRDELAITLFKGAGPSSDRERVIEHLPRDAPELDHIKLPVSEKWQAAAKEVERMRVEGETFAYAALKPLLEGQFDVIHCLEQEVCNVVYGHRHLFRRTPKVLFSNGGALPAHDLPGCDFVQEHTAFNLGRSDRRKAFLIPHGVDLRRFHPGVATEFRAHHSIPDDAMVVISVGTICYWHKRMDYVIREIAAVPRAWLVIAGQESADTPALTKLGTELMGDRIVFTSLPHEELPQAYAAADAFALGSLFETFGIAYIEAMAMGLPVICTDHPNQKAIVQQGIFIDVRKPGALSSVFRDTSREELRDVGRRCLEVARRDYDLAGLKDAYKRQYARIANAPDSLPRHTMWRAMGSNFKGLVRSARNIAANIRR